MRSGFSQPDLDRLTKTITGKLERTAARAARWWCFIFAPAIQSQAVQLAPLKTGKLRESAYSRVEGNQVEIGFSADYAARVHETTWTRHQVGQAKFLEQALQLSLSLALPGLQKTVEVGLRE